MRIRATPIVLAVALGLLGPAALIDDDDDADTTEPDDDRSPERDPQRVVDLEPTE